jgi:SAM-dependent methyltransferase
MNASAQRADATIGVEPVRESLPEKYARLDAFLKKLHGDVYPEASCQLHEDVTARAWAIFKSTRQLPARAKVLDIGCGQGVALKHFAADNLDALGIALGEDVAVCRQKGFNVIEMDLAFLDFPDQSFDLVWSRHVLEHSVFPYFSLAEISRVLKPGGFLYMEVPAPDTAANHQHNPNHYSVLTKSMWTELLLRVGFRQIERRDVNLELKIGPDVYWSFYAVK